MHFYPASRLRIILVCLFLCGILVSSRAIASGTEASRPEVKHWDHLTGNEAHLILSIEDFDSPESFLRNASNLLHLPEGFGFHRSGSYTDPWGSTHHRFQQTYDSYPIKGCVLILHLDEEASLNGRFLREADFAVQPGLAERQAFALALEEVGAEQYSWQMEDECRHEFLHAHEKQVPVGELMYFPMQSTRRQLGDFRLCYRYQITASKPHLVQEVYIDALSGEILSSQSMFHTNDVPATANTKYSGSRSITCDAHEGAYRLRESTGGGIRTLNLNQGTQIGDITDFTDSDTYWNNFNADQDEVATDAHWALEETYDLFKNLFSWYSFDNEDSQVENFVHYSESYQNSFWDPAGRVIIGDGDGESFLPFASLDVVGHEFSHGVVQHTADLVYAHEPGALSESFCDIFGNAVERSARPEDADWLIGADISLAYDALRSMSSPKELWDPDTYQGDYWISETASTVENDYGGVHNNSGVQNRWFYLISQGGNGTNDNGDSYSVAAIGQNKALQIAFLTLSAYLTNYSDYADARYYSIEAARQLFGDCSAEEVAVTNAWYAVGIGNPFQGQAPEAEFFAYPTEYCPVGSPVHFENQTPGADSYSWNFGDGTTSIWPNPIHTYDTPGLYTVTLSITGCGESDTRIRSSYIHISEDNDCIFDINYAGALNSCEGILFDQGGGTSNYPPNASESIVIAPTDASIVNLNFQSFRYAAGDYMKIYDGSSVSAPLIGTYSGTALPNGGSVSSSGPAITLEHYSNAVVQDAGFELSWTCEINECVPFNPSILTSSGSTSFCEGESIYLSTDQAYSSLQWSNNQSTSGISVSETGTYYLTLTDDDGCSGIGSITVFEQAAPSAFISPDVSICEGGSVTLAAGGGLAYQWSPTTGLSNPNIYNPVASPAGDQLYTVTVIDQYGCSDEKSVMVSVGGSLEIEVIEDVYLCPGQSVYLFASGGSQYSWSPQLALNDPYSATPIAAPLSDQVYTVTVSDGNSCEAEAEVHVHVGGAIPISISDDQVICSGESTQIQASGGVSYQWSPANSLSNANISNPIASPLYDQLYTVTVTDAQGCSAIEIVQVNVEAISTSVSADAHICAGGSATLSAYGGTSYQWSPEIGLSDPGLANPVASPPTDQLYTVLISNDQGCSQEQSVWVYLDAQMPVAVSEDLHICPGASATMTASGGQFYQWSPTIGLSNAFISNPAVTVQDNTLYTVSISDSNGCQEELSVMVYTDQELQIDISEDVQICPGTSAQLQASGGQYYSWSPPQGLSNPNIHNPIAAPDSDQLYTVMVSDLYGCVAEASVAVTLDDGLPVQAPDLVQICAGATAQLSATGGLYYQWSPATGLSNANIANPSVSVYEDTQYTVTVDDGFGCVGTATTLVEVGQAPTISTSPDVVICAGDFVDLEASGAVNYQWSPATGLTDINIANPSASPPGTQVYTVYGTDENGCTGYSTLSVDVLNFDPEISADQGMCAGESVNLSCAGTSFSWSPAAGLSDPTVGDPIASPSATTTYTVLAENEQGCVSEKSLTVYVYELGETSVSEDQVICSGETVLLEAFGGSQYQWSENVGQASLQLQQMAVAPQESQVYSVAISNGFGCSENHEVYVEVTVPPVIELSENQAMCPGDSVDIFALGAESVSWWPEIGLSDPGASSCYASPAYSTTYQATCTDASGCTYTRNVEVLVNDAPALLLSPDQTVCAGDAVALQASGNGSVLWSPQELFEDPTAIVQLLSPEESVQISVSLTTAGGCMETDSLQLTVLESFELANYQTLLVCPGEAIALPASNGSSYDWSPASLLSNAGVQNPVATLTEDQLFSVVIGQEGNGCKFIEEVYVEIAETGFAEIGESSLTLCEGEQLVLDASGGETYDWSPSAGLSDPSSPNPVFTATMAQEYTVAITSSQGCTEYKSLSISLHESDFANNGGDVEVCAGESVSLLASGGSFYLWSPATGLSDVSSPNPLASPNESTLYQTIVANEYGCRDTIKTFVSVQPSDFLQLNATDLSICRGEEVTMMASGAESYEWSPNLGQEAIQTVAPEYDQIYLVEALSAKGCMDYAQVNITVHHTKVAASQDRQICAGDQVKLWASGGESYFWNPFNMMTNPIGDRSTSAPAETTLYEVEIFDEHGCSYFEEVLVTVVECCESSGGGTSEWIASVGLNGLSNESGNGGGYESFGNLFEPMELGSSATLALEPGFALSSYVQNWRVWIDYNGDDSFDQSEMIFQSQNDEPVQGGFSIPENEEPGLKTMRVVMQLNDGSWPEPCEQFENGEVEDYLIELIEP